MTFKFTLTRQCLTQGDCNKYQASRVPSSSDPVKSGHGTSPEQVYGTTIVITWDGALIPHEFRACTETL